MNMKTKMNHEDNEDEDDVSVNKRAEASLDHGLRYGLA